MQKKAIALLSGGLDSTLALKIVLNLGFEVTALNMKTPFCTCDGKSGVCYSSKFAREFGIELVRIFGGEDYLKIVKNPEHGYGRNLNPCIDCRIYLFKKAKELMEKEGADFIFTGEVLGERPMSQRLDAMKLIERESGLKGKVLRPLSAKLLEPTLPEKEGLVDRSALLNLQGRSRKRQIELAGDYQIKDYPCPAGGCLLTEENFARRLKDSFNHNEDTLRHISLLKIGRHFRLPIENGSEGKGAKLIVGRDQKENELLLTLAQAEEIKFTVKEFKGALGVLLGEPLPDSKNLSARISARYCQGKSLTSLIVKSWTNSEDEHQEIEVMPLDDAQIWSYRV
jgi:tRNA U34 2-thiouridine synthase MnmA/TrmU